MRPVIFQDIALGQVVHIFSNVRETKSLPLFFKKKKFENFSRIFFPEIFFVRLSYEKTVAFFPKIIYNLLINLREVPKMDDWEFEMWWDAVNGMEEEESSENDEEW